MYTCTQLLQALESGACDEALSVLYAPDGGDLEAARSRAIRVTSALLKTFSPPEDCPAGLFSGPGRTEIGGNHTDHQHGRVLCASVDMDMLACAVPNGTRKIRVQSEGYPFLEVDLDDLALKPEEANSSAALVRGVAARLVQKGFSVEGFDAIVTSNVLSGSGVSSSAAYEILVGNILNHFYCADSQDPIELAKIGQYAENVYFGKPCGLMDQMGASIGGAVAIDFKDPANPVVTRADYDFAQSGHALCIIDTGSCHADLTGDYADITAEMKSVANCFDAEVLREVPEAEFRASIPYLRQVCGDRAVLRAMHFYEDDRRAVQEAEALKRGDFQAFLDLVNASGLSSSLHLQNTWSPVSPRQQAIPLALALGRELLGNSGAIRVHGGGFAGTIQAFVPFEMLDAFKSGMESVLGENKCHVLRIRPQGGWVVVA